MANVVDPIEIRFPSRPSRFCWVDGVEHELRQFYRSERYEHVLDLHRELSARWQITTDSPVSPDRQRIALDIRATFLASLEWLFSHFAAHELASEFPPAWLFAYETDDLRQYCREFSTRAQIAAMGTLPTQWGAQMQALLTSAPDQLSEAHAVELARLLYRLVRDFLDHAAESNSYKHGLRLWSTTFGIGLPDVGYQAHTPYGAMYWEADSIVDEHFLLSSKVLAFDPERDLRALGFVGQSLARLHQAQAIRRGFDQTFTAFFADADTVDLTPHFGGPVGFQFKITVTPEEVRRWKQARRKAKKEA